MKTRNDHIVLILSSAVCLLPLILSFAVYHALPAQIAIHWNSAGTPDRYAPKSVAAFGLPVFFLAINLFSKMWLFHDPKRANSPQAIQLFAAWTPPLLSLILVPVTLFIAMGVNISISVITPALVGFLLLVCGNYLPKTRQNYTIGIRLPWTLYSADNWNKTHRLAGFLYTGGGFLLITVTFLFTGDRAVIGISLAALVVVLIAVVPVAYSFFLYRKRGGGTHGADE